MTPREIRDGDALIGFSCPSCGTRRVVKVDGDAAELANLRRATDACCRCSICGGMLVGRLYNGQHEACAEKRIVAVLRAGADAAERGLALTPVMVNASESVLEVIRERNAWPQDFPEVYK